MVQGVSDGGHLDELGLWVPLRQERQVLVHHLWYQQPQHSGHDHTCEALLWSSWWSHVFFL